MRFLHTADWHLGRVYHGVSLLDDQAYALDDFVRLARDTGPAAILIAGDVYDRSVPPADAVRLLDETLTRLVIGEKIPVVLIAGNHDGPDRLGFGSRLLAAAGLTVRGVVGRAVEPVVFADGGVRVAVYPLPYAEPALVRSVFADDSLADHQRSLAAQLDAIRAAHDPALRSIIVAHAFVQGGSVAESERPLSVGGSGAVGGEVFAGFDFVALGHLHRPQSVGAERIHYAGSLLKYSFAEADHAKSVSLIDLDAAGAVGVERLPLAVRRDLRILAGSLDQILAAGIDDPGRDDYILARLDDTGAILDAMGKLRSVYANALAVERPRQAGAGGGLDAGQDHRRIGVQELFAGFYKEVTGLDLEDDAGRVLGSTIEGLALAGREAGE